MGEEFDDNPLDFIGPLVSAWLESREGSKVNGEPKGFPKFDDGFPNTDWSGETLAVVSDDPKGLIDAPNGDVGLSSFNNGLEGGPLLKGEKSSFLLKLYVVEFGPDTEEGELCFGLEPNGTEVVG
jgi:hypothetical protein